MDNLEASRGRPKYRSGRCPSWKSRIASRVSLEAAADRDRIRLLFWRFAWSPESSAKPLYRLTLPMKENPPFCSMRWSSINVSTSITKTNRNGDIGSPCRRPRAPLKKP
ncbi:UNVERIFIED_CONTAM: hypothetical protein Sradi_6888900 [Sesamum radiatum]|uniref:Uncharacterized protein n=1 Tax=Sesamum radiatum TaxID=300843 RepID=A0AAW2JJ16_SESRA